MKIALIHPQIIRSTGVETFLIDFARRLLAAGHELTYISTLTTPEIGASLPGNWQLLPRIRGSAAVRMWHFDRLAPRAALEAGVQLSIGFGRTSVQTLHRNGTGCLRLYGAQLPWWLRYSVRHLYELHLEKRLYSGLGTQRFVVSSARIAAQLQGIYRTQPERMSILTPPVETQLFRPSEHRANVRELLCRKLQTDPKHRILLFISLSHRRRGLEPLLQAMRQVPQDAVLWVAGKKPNATQLALIQQHGLASRVRVVPVTTNLVELYQSADWLVHPTLYDAFSAPVWQSMACGLPGLISVMDGAVDHIRNEENGFMLYHPHQPAELAARIQEALSYDAAAWQSISAAARQTVISHTWEKHMQEWSELMGL